MRYLTVQEVESINHYIILKYSPTEDKGVKYPGLLESAVARPQQSVFGKDAYPSIEQKGAALFESLAQNHAFQNANKRTAFLSLTQFLSYNGFDFEMATQDQVQFTVDIVTHDLSFKEIVSIIKENNRQID
ncbi:type II toxin-antitoxin system death-on-curing family toxin [Salibacterium aidingense]|uniref:type II toxin-antitoxin system death-on-curing family toxin n=1 Tax=Salibacterium aidingense TaxID=384933 RepID=UPI003BBF5ECC